MSEVVSKSKSENIQMPTLSALTLSAIGVVFGDIGTSPLYTFKTVLALTGDKPSAAAILGSLSLIIWTLIIVTTVKYVNIAMRISNDGEGGILALMSLLGVKLRRRPVVVALGLMGAALIYGDGAITPAISVLSALEGLNIVAPHIQPYVLPSAIAILLLLFAVQPRGTSRIGSLFGPVMLLWFAVIALLGLWGIIKHPSVLWAINPVYGFRFLFAGGAKEFFILGGVFLCVTGAEALYADMGHFGAKPIRLAWSAVVFPSLLLNYAGQAALVLEGAPTADNIFYRLCPQGWIIPMVILATVATIIASQAIITGAFSMTRQAIQLGWLPRMEITQTCAEGYGQIYIGVVNWLLMLVTVALALGFGKSDNIASAYGIAVSSTMLATTALLFLAMREIWHWNWFKSAALTGILLIVDGSFFVANLSKIAEGGYIPLLVAAVIYILMNIWHRGSHIAFNYVTQDIAALDVFMKKVNEKQVARVPGTAVFLTRMKENTPPVMAWHVKQNHALQEQVFILTVTMQSVPWVRGNDRIIVSKVEPNLWRGQANYGFMESPHIPQLLKMALTAGCPINFKHVTYYVGHETIMPAKDKKLLHRWMIAVFAFMQRNGLHVGDYLQLPSEAVVEIGRQLKI